MFAQVIDQPGHTMEDYQRVMTLVGDEPIDGRVAHLVGATADGICVVEVWETRGQAERFVRERLGAALTEVFAGRTPTPRVTDLDEVRLTVAATSAEVR